jgi:hypothetical protein
MPDTDTKPYSAAEVRAWLGSAAGTRGRIARGDIEKWLRSDKGRAKELLKAAGLWPKNNHPSDATYQALSERLAFPGKFRPKGMLTPEPADAEA